MSKLPLAAVLLILTLASAACGSPEPAPAPPPPVESSAPSSAPAAAGLPPAADGTNLEACRDGACQVSVTGSAQTVVNGRPTKITVRDGRAQITMSDSSNNRISSGLRPGNTTTMVSSGHKLVIRLVAARGDTAVVQFSAN
ncbi:hypothetical protein GCM10023321_09200 [Pseudonocardia eucalypti]|uniref:Uncharacterized protein n=1 Tax=Pseudonocardia eucalypti TaxID=648755 RepID=A0ABP9PPS0_9PSEU|nr:hypothetical protein [Pseudonocardia eucalypti]